VAAAITEHNARAYLSKYHLDQGDERLQTGYSPAVAAAIRVNPQPSALNPEP
jgi:hypothetical protein